MLHAAKAKQRGSDPYLKTFHAALKPELSAIIGRYRLGGSVRVLDVPCGDGFYTSLFARHMRGGALIAADQSAKYLAVARRQVTRSVGGPHVKFRRADVYAMPFDSGSIDFVWCAQSMISLDDPVAALREIRRVLCPGGRVAVLETDEFHHVVLPWPVRFEVSLQQAIRKTCKRKYGDGAKFAQARRLRLAFLDSGFKPGRKKTLAADRQAPFGPAEREFLTEHMAFVRKRFVPELIALDRAEFYRFSDPELPDSIFNRPDAEMTILASVHHARS